MNKDQFRRDEIAIVSKEENGVSKISALSNYKVRKDASYSKDYINGKFGGIPIIDYSLIYGGNESGQD